MNTKKRPWTRAEKWFAFLTLLCVAALSLWGWVESQPLPPRLIQPKGAFVWSMLLSPDQNHLAVGADIYSGSGIHSGAVTLWDSRTLKPEPIFRTPKEVRIFCVSNDATQIGTLDKASNLFEWRDRSTQQLLWSFAIPNVTFRRAFFLKKKSQILLIASGSSPKKPRVFLLSARTGIIQKSWEGESSLEYKSGLSPDERILAYSTPSLQKIPSLTLCRTDNGNILKSWKIARLWGTPIFSPEGSALFSLTDPLWSEALATNSVIRIDTNTGKQIWSFNALSVASDINAYRRFQTRKQANRVNAVMFSGVAISVDGAIVAVLRGIDSTIYLLDSRTGKVKRTLSLPLGKAEFSDSYVPTNLLFAPDGKHLFAQTNDSIFAWDLN